MGSKGEMYKVVVPVAELRSRAAAPQKKEWVDRELETQLLWGEKVKLLSEEGGFYFIEAVEQQVFAQQNGWGGYRGYVAKDALERQKNDGEEEGTILAFKAAAYAAKALTDPLFNLSFGTTVSFVREGDWLALSLKQGKKGWIRKEAVQQDLEFTVHSPGGSALFAAKKFLGTRYLWGGRSSPSEEEGPLRGVDCSALVNLSFKAIGINIPRNAHDQFLRAVKIPFNQLRPGDLIFSSEKGLAGRIDHVMMAAGDECLIEAVMSQGTVRLISWEDKWGESPVMEESSQMIGGVAVHAATLFSSAMLK